MSSYQPGFIPQEENGLFKICPSELNATLDSLHPGTNYTLSIRAKTDAGFGEAVEITASTKIARELCLCCGCIYFMVEWNQSTAFICKNMCCLHHQINNFITSSLITEIGSESIFFCAVV